MIYPNIQTITILYMLENHLETIILKLMDSLKS